MIAPPTPPAFGSIQEFVSRLGDVDSWWPSVAEVLERHDLAGAGREPVAGFNATYPTVLYGDVVVKLFGRSRSWRAGRGAERSARALLAIDRFLRADTSSASHCRFMPGQGDAHARW